MEGLLFMFNIALIILVIIDFSSKSKDDKGNSKAFFGYKE